MARSELIFRFRELANFSTFLKISEVYLKLDTTYFFQSSFFLGLKFVIQSIAGLIISVSISRFAGPYVFGQFNLFIAIIGFISIVSLPGLNLALIQSTSKGYTSSLKYAFLSSLKYSIIGTPLMLIVALYFFLRGDFAFSYSFLIISLIFPFIYSTNLFDYFLIGIKNYKKSFFFTTVVSTITAISVVVAIIFVKRIDSLLLAYFLLPTIFGLLITLKLIGSIKHKKEDEDLLRYGKFLTLTVSLLPLVSSYLDKILIGYFLGVEQLAFYSVSQVFPENLKNMIKVLSFSLIPKISTMSEDNFLTTFRVHFVKLLVIGVALSAILWIILPIAIEIIFSNTYNYSIGLAKISSLSLIMYPLTNVIQQKFLAHKNRLELTTYIVLSNLTRIIIYIIFIPFYDLIGLIWGLVLYSILNLFYLMINLKLNFLRV